MPPTSLPAAPPLPPFSVIAARCGLSRAHVSRVLRGLSNPTYNTLYRIATALDMSVLELLAVIDARGAT